MEKEFKTLSEKIFGPIEEMDIMAIDIKDIKEFIERLKEDIIIPNYYGDKVGFVINTFVSRINKLAGDKLI